MSKWETVTWEIIPPKLGPHRWKTTKSFHWTYCDRCGIMITKLWGKIKSCNNCKRKFMVCDG